MREFVGKVITGRFAARSKSEHNAVYLQTGERSFVLRRKGGNPFSDPEIARLVGKTIRCRGDATDHTLIMIDWSVVDE